MGLALVQVSGSGLLSILPEYNYPYSMNGRTIVVGNPLVSLAPSQNKSLIRLVDTHTHPNY